jgi:archaellum biogenesis ATPase FlaH
MSAKREVTQDEQDRRDVRELLFNHRRREHFDTYGVLPDGVKDEQDGARYKRVEKLLKDTERDVRVFLADRGKASPSLDRHSGRRVDIARLLREPQRPTPWRCGEVVADGTLTVVSGQSGDGKSWLALALAVGVARGEAVAGIPCMPGTALYIDAEMGQSQFVERLRAAGVGAEIELRDAMGLDLSRDDDLEWLRDQIEDTVADLVVIDSLRRLVPSKSENDSDDMAPTVAALAKLARDLDTAIVLVHHMGDSKEKLYRGSSAIKDQADALFGLLRDDNDPDVRRLTCRGGKGKMRYAPEPADRFLAISPKDGGVTETIEPADDDEQSVRVDLEDGILSNLPGNKSGVAAALGRNLQDWSFRKAWEALVQAKTIDRDGNIWRVVVVAATPATTTTTTSSNGAHNPNVEEWERLVEMSR